MNPLKWIIAYKFAHAVVALLAAVACLVMALGWLDEGARAWARDLSVDADGSWLELTSTLSSALESDHLVLIGVALVFDAALVFIEGLALWRRWWWGRWLVVAASVTFVPFEVFALANEITVFRVLLLLINLAVAFWLLRHKLSPAPVLSRVAVT